MFSILSAPVRAPFQKYRFGTGIGLNLNDTQPYMSPANMTHMFWTAVWTPCWSFKHCIDTMCSNCYFWGNARSQKDWCKLYMGPGLGKFEISPPVGDPREDPGHAGKTLSHGWPGNASGSPEKSWTKWLRRGKSGLPCLGCCPRDPTLDKRKKMDGFHLHSHCQLLL